MIQYRRIQVSVIKMPRTCFAYIKNQIINLYFANNSVSFACDNPPLDSVL